jgi:GTP pyrophosphokinase
VGAKVNGKLVPLRYTLRQGDIVEIVTSPNQHPSRDWLQIVKSSRARSKINQWLKVEERSRSITLGREFFEREVKKHHLNAATLLGSEELKKIVSDLLPVHRCLGRHRYGKSSGTSSSTSWPPAARAGRQPKPAPTRAVPDQGVRIRGWRICWCA